MADWDVVSRVPAQQGAADDPWAVVSRQPAQAADPFLDETNFQSSSTPSAFMRLTEGTPLHGIATTGRDLSSRFLGSLVGIGANVADVLSPDAVGARRHSLPVRATTGLMDAATGAIGALGGAIEWAQEANPWLDPGGLGSSLSGVADRHFAGRAEQQAAWDAARAAAGEPSLAEENAGRIGNRLADWMRGHAEDLSGNVSPRQIEADRSVQEALESPSALMSALIDRPLGFTADAFRVAGPGTAAYMVPGALATRGARLAGIAPEGAAAAGVGAQAGAISLGGAEDAAAAVMGATIEDLRQIPEFQQLEAELGEEAARAALAEQAYNVALASGAGINTATMGLAQRYGFNPVGDMLAGVARRSPGSAARTVAARGLAEAGGELVEEGGEAVAQELAAEAAGTRKEGSGARVLAQGLFGAGIGLPGGLMAGGVEVATRPTLPDAMGSAQPEAPAAGAGDGSGVQSEQALSAAMAEPDLTPRAPATPTIEEGVSREQLVEEWRNAATPDARAAAAARIAAHDAQRDDAGAADSGPVDADGAAGAQAEAAGLPAQDSGPATPPPDLPQFPGLTDAQREIEARAAEQVRSDPDGALQAYTEVPGTDGGRIVNTDEAREIFPDYNSGPEARSTNAVAVHEPASWVANETFRRRMAAPVAEDRDASVFFTGGGTGAGKSTGPKRIAEIGAVMDAADTVFDGNLSSERSAVDKIERALESGRDVHILYTFRDPVQAFVHGALPRAERADYGRTVPTGPHAGAHVGAAQTYFALRDRYADDPRVSIRAVWNDFEPGVRSEIREATEEEIRAIADTDRGTLQQELNDALEQERQAGRVSDRVYYGTRGEPQPQRGQERGVEAPEQLDRRASEEQPAPPSGPDQEQVAPDTESSVRRVLPRSANVTVVRTASDIPQEVRERVGLTDADTDVEGFYDSDTQTAYVIEDSLVPREGQPVEARAAWVAAHEWVGHHGLRELAGEQLGTVLRRARNNDTVAAVVRAMERERPERGPALVEEALVELAAAVRTNDYVEISNRYGVEFTADSRGNLRRLIDRLLNALRRALGWDGFTDAELYDLIADSAAAAAGGPETVLVGDRAPRSRVGTRNPTAVRSTESGVDPETTVGYESFRADPKAFERNTQLLLEYPGIRRPRGRVTPNRIAESFIEHSVANLLELHDRMPAQDRAVAKDWYIGANRAAERLASEYGITDVQAAASIAALSPQKDWFQNLSLAERVIDASVNHADRAWDPGMSETLGNIFGGEKYGALRAAVEGRRLSELSDPVERAAWIRTYDQTHNDSAFPITSPRGDLVGTQTTAAGTPARIQWGSLAEVAKAVSVLEDGSLENVSALLGRQHKIRSFYNNIIEPTNDSDVTIDTHAVAAALLRPLSAATTEVGHNFGTGTSNSSVTGNSGMYGLYAEAYRRAAAERGVLPREMQSITWEAVRALYLPPSRRPNSRVVRDTEYAWNEYKQRRIEHGEAVERAVDAGGGIRRPDWAGSASRLDEGEWRRAFRPAVSGAGVPGRGAGPVASRRRDPGRADRGVHPDAAATLNIGLSTAEMRGGGELSRARVMRVLRRTGVNVLADSRHVSDSEPTLVVDIDRPLTAEEGDEVSAALDQEAIVQRNVDGSGELFGPMAEAWGPYNPKLFVMPDGDRADRRPVASRGRRTATGRRGRTAQAFSAKPRQPDAVSADAYHYSNTPGLTELDPTFAGTAGAGRERRAFGMGRFGERGGTYARLNFYVREPGAPVPLAEDVVRGAGGSNLYRVRLDNLYDLDNDPRGIVADAGPNVTLMEEEIADAGFDGFLAGPQPGIDTPVAVVFDLPGTVPVENVDGSQPLPQQQAEPEWEDPNEWWEQYEARRGAPRSRARRTADDARREKGKLFGRLAADGYRMGSPTQTSDQTGGRFATVKQARDAALIALHDKMLPLLRAQQQVAEDGRGISSITLDDAMNAYRAENLMHGAVNDELTGLHYSHIRPIQEAIRKSPFSVDMFEDYLYAKAAPERNREIAKINKDMPDAGSGITTQMAKDIMAGKADGVFSGKRLTPEAIALFDDLNRHVRALRNAALNNMIDAGQITPELAASLRKKYPNYVPMRGKDAELDEGRGRPGSGRGLSQRRANIRRALGRGADNVPVNILGELVGDAQRSVVAKGKAKVARAMLRFALANPNPDLYTVEPVDLEWRFSEATGEAYLGVKRRGEDVDTSMVVMHKGNPVYLRFNDPQLAAAMLNAGVEDMGKMMRVFSALNRWRSATLTRYNPAFTPVNMARDFHFGTVAIAAEHGPRIAAQTVANYPSAMRASYRHAAGRRGDASKPDSEKTMQDWAAEAYATGMSTGITHTPNVVDLQRNLQAATMGVIELAASGRPLAAAGQALYRTGRPIIDAIESANEASENAMRLGVYVALRKDGMSKTRAAEYAKNVTINFNRKGKAGPILNAIFLFYNAAMQGGHAVLRVMRNPKVMTYLIGLSIMQGLLAAGQMDDDDGDGITEWDKIPDYVKRTSLVIPIGEDRYFAMPMPYGFNWFTYLGGRGTQRMILGDRPTDSSIMVDLAKSLSEAFSPIPLEDGYRSLFGDQVGLAMGLAANRDDFGSPIAQLNPYERYPEPRALQGKVTTPGMYHVMAQLMAKAGGGDLDERLPPIGWLDVAPEQIEELVNHFGGGVTSLGNRGLRAFEQMQAGNLDNAFDALSSAPITSRLLVSPRESFAIADRYYSERGEFARHKDIVNNRLAQGMSLDEALSDRPPEYFAGGRQATYKRRGRRQDGTRYRRGEGRVDAEGNPLIEYPEGTPQDVLKSAERRVKSLNDAVREIRAATITNAELAEMYSTHYDAHARGLGQAGAIDGVTGRPADIGLPDDFDGEAKAPARVRNRAIKILQDMRAEEQRRLLRSLEYERTLQSARRS